MTELTFLNILKQYIFFKFLDKINSIILKY